MKLTNFIVFVFFLIFSPMLLFAEGLDATVVSVLTYAVVNFPIVALVLMVAGGLFVILELFFKATPNKEDDKKWAAIKSGYLAPFIGYTMTFFKNKVFPKR